MKANDYYYFNHDYVSEESTNLYNTLISTLVTGALTCGALESLLVEGDHKSAAILGAFDIVNVVSWIANYRLARKSVDKK